MTFKKGDRVVWYPAKLSIRALRSDLGCRIKRMPSPIFGVIKSISNVGASTYPIEVMWDTGDVWGPGTIEFTLDGFIKDTWRFCPLQNAVNISVLNNALKL